MTLEVVFCCCCFGGVFFGINQHMKKTIIKSTNNFVIYQVFESRDANKLWSPGDSLSGKLDGNTLSELAY